jgi:hypothetical protein
MSQGAGAEQQVPELRLKRLIEPFVLVIELEAWNIRERNPKDWGQTEELRKKGRGSGVVALGLWWDVFSIESTSADQRGPFADPESWNGGLEALKQQIWAEAMRHGLGQAKEVIVIADGAVWIWNLVKDRLGGARQRLDPWHALQHLWAVAHALHPENLENNRDRLDYKGAKERGEPLGSGAIESTCRQCQCRFHRPGQFWTTKGDEALLCLETFWRNSRWSLLFPHVPSDFDPSKN